MAQPTISSAQTQDMRSLVAAFDWSCTSLGPREGWPHSLRTVADLVLSSAFPMILLWGDDLIQLYNDGYRVILGARHPAALGRPTREVWPEVWHINEPLYEGVRRGETYYFENQPYPIARNGALEEAYFTLCYSPVHDDAGRVGGVLVTVAETTAQVVLARRQEAQHLLADGLAGAVSVGDVRRAVTQMNALPDVPFAELCLGSDATFPAELQGVVALREPETLDWRAGDAARPALALPVDGLTHGEASGALVVGLGVHLALDGAYRRFLANLARQVGAALNRALAQEQGEQNRELAEERAAALAESEARQAFLLGLSDALRPLADAAQIQAEASRVLGEHLGVDRAYYVEVGEAAGVARVERDYLRGDSPSLSGEHRVEDFGWVIPPMRQGETLVISDVADSPLVPATDRAIMEAVRIAAHVNAPLVKGGALVGALCVTESAPRAWAGGEVELVREVAERIWAAVERARAEAALRASEEWARTLIRNLPGGAAFIFDRNLRYVLAEGEALYATGRTPADFEGKTVAEANPPERAAQLQVPLRRALEDEAFEVEHAQDHRTFMSRGVPLRGGGGVAGVLVVSYEITARKRAEEALGALNTVLEARVEERTRRLADLNAELKAYAAGVSRDLEEPARRIKGFLDLIERRLGGRNDEKTAYYFGLLRDEAARLAPVARELRQFARLEGRELVIEDVPLSLLVVQARSDLEPHGQERAARWTVGALPVVRGDKALLQLALTEVLAFALGAARAQERPTVEVGAQAQEGEVELWVRFGGREFTPQQAERLFEATMRDAPPEGAERIGLLNVRRIVARHGGKAWAEGCREGGVVRLTLPKAP